MQLSPEDLERRVLLLERQLKSIVEAGRSRSGTDRSIITPTGASDIVVASNVLYLFPCFPEAPIQAAGVFLSARRNPANPGTSSIQLALYRSILDERFTPVSPDSAEWGESTGQVTNRTQWRKIAESRVCAESTSVASRFRWNFPHDAPLTPGLGVYAIGLITDSVDTYFQGVSENVHFSAIRASDTASCGDLPATVTSVRASTINAISLTLYSKRGMKTLGR